MDSDEEEEEVEKVQADGTHAATVQIYARALGTNECTRTGACRGASDALTCVEAWADGTIRDDAMRAMCGRDDWRGVEALGRERGASASSVDAESGWSATHACAHLGNLRSARALSSACGKTFDWEAPTDWRGRAPVDLVSEKVCAARVKRRQRRANDGREDEGEDEDEADEETRFAYAWGSGANFSLGTGSTETERRPARVDALFKANVRECATNKVHGLAVDSDGEIWVWGCTRDGVLGLGRENREESTAVIFPTPLRGFGLASDVKIVKVSAGLAHSAATTSDGALYAWGCGKDGRLGYVVVDDEDGCLDGLMDEEREERRFTQYRPKRVPNLAGVFITNVACGDSHTVALDARGSVWTMGSNARGQLGYFVPDRSNDGAKCGAAPNEPCCSTAKQVEYLKHRELVVECVSASRHHTLVSTATGDAYSFGHGSTSVRRVATPRHDFVSWHQVDPRIVKVSAGVEHSAAMTRDGWVYVWASASEHLQAKMLKGLPGGCAADVSCGANRCAVVNATGEVYTWETSSTRRVNAPFGASSGGGFALGGASPRSFGTSPRSLESPRMNYDIGDILLTRVRGLKGVERVFSGDAHFLAIQVITKPRFSLGRLDPLRKRRVVESELDKLIRDIGAVPASPLDALRGDNEDVDDEEETRGRLNENQVDATKSFPSLVLLAQHAVANAYIEPRNALDVVQLADQINAVALKRYAMEYAIKNLDVVLLETPKNAFHEIDNQYLKELTKLMRSGKVVDGWSDDALQTRCEHVESLEEIKRASKTSSRRVRVIKNDEDVESPPSVAKPPLAKILTQSRDAPTAGRNLDNSPRPSRSTTKTRGSLSMFLSGALEGKSPNSNKWSSSPTSPQSQASPDDEERLARQTQRLSLREIQSQQERAAVSAARMGPPSTSVDAPPVFSPSPASPNAVSLGDLIRRKRGVGSSPAWNSPVASSPTGAPSNLRDILNAEAAEAARRETHSVTTGFNIPKSPGDRWYVPTEAPAVSLRDILDEESEARDDAEAAELAAALAAINAQETAEALELIAKSEEASSKDRRKRRSGASSAAQKPRRGGGKAKAKDPASAEPSTSMMKPNKDHHHGAKKPPPPSNSPKDHDDDDVKSKAPSRRRRASIQPNAVERDATRPSVHSSSTTARDSRHRRRRRTGTKNEATTNEE